MTTPTFYCDDRGDLWFGDWNRGSDWMARLHMEQQAEFYEAQPQTGLYASHSRQCAAECRAALAKFDKHHRMPIRFSPMSTTC